jgi:hypothetical protein
MNGVEDQETPDAEPKRSGRTPEGSAASSRNGLKLGLRARTQFPIAMGQRIAERTAKLKEELKPRTELEGMLVTEIARTSVQVDVAEEVIVVNVELTRELLDDQTWDDDRTEEINKKAARIGRDPYTVQRTLLQTKQGVKWLLYRWRMLDQMIRCNSGLNDTQRQLCFDLLGVPETGRAGTETVPAGDDAAGLRALVAREVKKLEDRLNLVLETRDLWARKKVKLGLRTPPDPDIKNLKSDRSRAYKRMTWALETFRGVRAGTLDGPIIDPETKKPMAGAHAGNGAPEEPPQSQSKPQPPPEPASAPVQPPAAEPDTPPDPLDDEPLPMPDNVPYEETETFQVVGATLRGLLRAGILKLPGTG